MDSQDLLQSVMSKPIKGVLKSVAMVYVYNPNARKVEAVVTGVQCQLWLNGELEAN